ncbi:MAG TPA: hypothetical protein VH413_16385 [Verrucomicrobiae bacterium]|jgi:hypothetical protein|nr:hypothetical protein [Verrucomicrobiae bacterium]
MNPPVYDTGDFDSADDPGTSDFETDLNMDRNKAIPDVRILARTVYGFGGSVGFQSFNDGTGTQSQAELYKVWGKRSITNNNSQGKIYYELPAGTVAYTHALPATNAYQFDSATNVPKADMEIPGVDFLIFDFTANTITAPPVTTWTITDGAQNSAGEDEAAQGLTEGGGFFRANTTTKTATVVHTFWDPNSPNIHNPPDGNLALDPLGPGDVTFDILVENSDEIPLSILSDPLIAALTKFDFTTLLWQQSTQLNLNRWGDGDGSEVAGIEDVDLTTIDFSQWDGKIIPGGGGQGPSFGADAYGFSFPNAGLLGENQFGGVNETAQGRWFGARTQVLFLTAGVKYTVTRVDIGSDTLPRNSTIVSQGVSKFGQVIDLNPASEWTPPAYDSPYPFDQPFLCGLGYQVNILP